MPFSPAPLGFVMIAVDVSGDAEIIKALKPFIGIDKAATTAAAKSLTFSAQDTQDYLRSEMEKIFDRPTRFTLNSLRIKSATRNNLQAAVYFKDISGRAQHYLVPQVEGGERPQKGLEQRLKRARPAGLGPHEFLVPTKYAQFDGYGNVKRAQIIRISSQLKILDTEGGFNASPTKSRRSRRKRARYQYFWSPGRGEFNGRQIHLERGIWERIITGFGVGVRPVFLAVEEVKYKQRFDFYGDGQRFARDRFALHFDRQLSRELAKAGIR